ncbi:BREX-1 system adenine-specific DNA-methyltransferase PglX [Sulfurimonas sp. SWIR-19]|uniref:BREX-1 system adenine-specific DNA-methyltransferase PglX n=1 Tax=Sulfurimonas sp. SWIR-19 TaxID=2878390 RepID=UPI001CF536F1|nr:BREX-1 system adenine-specific DNA-methyltransferase PglX [Sulfurimonas sp. SWIR-19]UCN01373.1 BREX-1 system adenine-specific DNA-methyltransferase PglX [Sulfurimonas sp. SWIR-19]
MKLADHVDSIRELIYKAFDKQFGRLGIGAKKIIEIEKLPSQLHSKRKRIEEIIRSHVSETGSFEDAREKALEEYTFTLFNRIAAIKVMESHNLFPPVITKESIHGDRSFGHKVWLEENPQNRSEELEGIREYIKYAFNTLASELLLYSKEHPYALLPYVIELNEIIDAFNSVEKDTQIEDDIWKNDDILGWLYESYNNAKKQAFKDSKAKTEYDKVSLQSQVYTPKWVVEFLVNNSLGKLYLEMYPNSNIKNRYKIANAPSQNCRDIKALHEVKLIDPASGSGNFLLYAYDLFYELYMDQIDNFGADYEEKDIPKLIIENNLHGIDLDDRAIQLAQLGLYIKAKRKRRTISDLHFNVISSDFYLPEYEDVQEIFESSELNSEQQNLVKDIWDDLKYAYKFGSLIKIGEKIQTKVEAIYDRVQREGQDLFNTADIQDYYMFEQNFFKNLENAVEKYASNVGSSFLANKTADAMVFLKLVSQKYDVATANPPYTDSSDFGKDLKEFIEANYKKPYKFNTNLYATFIKRCYELTDENGKIAMVHPPTFMYIKTFEDVRKFIIDKTFIDFFVEWGYLGMFNPSARVDSAMYILSKNKSDKDSAFMKLNELYEGKRFDVFNEALDDYITKKTNKHNYTISQSKLKIIKSYPFIYWISDEFREKFGINTIDNVFPPKNGLQTGDNNRFVRFWWEHTNHYTMDDIKWKIYAKGGPYQKWFGNLWTTVNWLETGALQNKTTKGFFKEGINFSGTSSKGTPFRYLPEGCTFDNDAPLMFPIKKYKNINYGLAVVNSSLITYILSCLNPTVKTQVGDVKRIPFVIPEKAQEEKISAMSQSNIKIKKDLSTFSLVEINFNKSPLYFSSANDLKQRIIEYLNYENHLLTQILINEAIINEEIFKVYKLNENDIKMVLEKEGQSIGGLEVESEAIDAYLQASYEEFELDNIKEYIQNLPTISFEESFKSDIISKFESLYQNNNDLEEFCIKNKVSPINVWYWFKNSRVLPKHRKEDIAMEFLADMLREILNEDDDGIVPLVPNAGEKILYERVHEKFIEKGFSQAQFSSFDSLLGKEVNDYLNNHFFKDFSDHLNLFMYMPKTPFIWHLSSGANRGFEAFIIIYKWGRDNLLRLRSVYIEHRERALENRKIDIQNDNSPKAQNEKDIISKQLIEINEFKAKIDDLLQSGYDPKLDDGVGKNIAPLQKRKMLSYDVLNAGQLKKYLNADW